MRKDGYQPESFVHQTFSRTDKTTPDVPSTTMLDSIPQLIYVFFTREDSFLRRSGVNRAAIKKNEKSILNNIIPDVDAAGKEAMFSSIDDYVYDLVLKVNKKKPGFWSRLAKRAVNKGECTQQQADDFLKKYDL